MPIINTPKNFNLEFNPLEFLYLILSKSSVNPNKPKANEMKIKHQNPFSRIF